MAGEVIGEAGLGGSITEEYIFFNGRRIARRDNPSSVVHYYFADHLGTHGVVTNATGTFPFEQDMDYYPYGGVEHDYSTAPVAQNYKFTGKERDSESGLDEFGARNYSSSLGRFMIPDWAATATATAVPYAYFGNPQSLNLYSYVQNNPTTIGDPDGHAGDYAQPLPTPEAQSAACDTCAEDTSGGISTGVEDKAAKQAATAQNQSNTQTQQNPLPSPGQKVLTQVEKQFPDLNVTNVKDLKAHNGHENISVTGSATNDQMAQIKKTLADNAGLFGPGSGINIEIGNGTYSLHVEFAQFSSSGDTSSVRFQSHIDRGNPNAGPVGLFKHVFVDGLVGAVFHHNDPGLDPQ